MVVISNFYLGSFDTYSTRRKNQRWKFRCIIIFKVHNNVAEYNYDGMLNFNKDFN
jgi:hypothetical protein